MDSAALSGASDEGLVTLASEDEEALNLLIARYARLVWYKARGLQSCLQDSGMDAEDLVQEGMLGLLNAISCYDPDRAVSFSTFASVCIENKMRSALLKSGRAAALLSGDDTSPEEMDSEDPETILLRKERIRDYWSAVRQALSEQEFAVFRLYLQGKSYAETAFSLNITEKSVDNAMQRIRRKLRSVFKRELIQGNS